MLKEKPNQEDKKIAQMLEHVKNRMLVFSGKGGVGKSTVAANLALAMSRKGLKVGLLDVDIHGPNLAKMLGAENMRVEMLQNSILPVSINENLKLISMAFFLEKIDIPVVWRGPLKMKAIQQFLGDVRWGDLDWLICDSPPGTGDEPLSVAQLIPATGAVIVTTPQEVSLLDSRKAVTFARMLKLKILGVVENMSGFVCPHCGKEIDLFKSGGGEKIAREYNIPFLGRIPIDPKIVESGDKGQLAVLLAEGGPAAKVFEDIVEKICKNSET
jgi:ATP-binding protein involved in chromosome partitioning